MKIDNLKDSIIDRYTNNGESTVIIANDIGCSQGTVERLLKRNGIKMTPHRFNLKVNDENRAKIFALYQSGATTIEIGKEFNVSDVTVAKIVREFGGTIRLAQRRSVVRHHDYFDLIDTKAKAYFLGWMITDGTVIEGKRGRSDTIRISITDKDMYILEKFAQEIGGNDNLVKKFEKRNQVYVAFASQYMSNSLKRYGVVPRKTNKMYLPEVNDKLMPHLIRGIFDGNGTITFDSRWNIGKFAFYGSETLCRQLKDYLCRQIDLNDNKVSFSSGCYHVWWSGKKQLQDFYTYIYKDSAGLRLERKYNKFMAYC